MKVEYGISIASCDSCGELLSSGALNELFDCVEAPGQMLYAKRHFDALARGNWTSRRMIDIMPPSLTRGIIEQSRGIIEDFKLQVAILLDKACELRVDSFVIDFSLESALANDDFRKSAILLFKAMAPMFSRKKIQLFIPVRIPLANQRLSEFYHSFLKETMCPCFKFAINVYPHELTKGFSPKELLRWFRFDIGALRLVYEPEMGNRLVEKLVLPWDEYLKENAAISEIFFCPRISSRERFLEEADNLRGMLVKMRES